jgi:hypothetical protein
MKIKYSIIIITFCFLANVGLAQAISIGVKPTKINIAEQIGERKTAQLLIKNTGQEPAMYQVYPDKYEKNVKVNPGEFKLDVSEEKIIDISFRWWWPGNFNSDLAVIARPLNVGQAVSVPGVKIPLHIKVSPSFLDYLIIICTILVIVLFVVQLKRRKKQFYASK